MEILSKLFGGAGIVKILRLFLFNGDEPFELKDIAERTKTTSDVVRNEIAMLSKIGFIRKRSFYKEVEAPKTRRRVEHTENANEKKPQRKRVPGWILNKDFLYLNELRSLLVGTAPFETTDIARRLRTVGSVKAVIISGVFVQHWDGRLDILIVADNVKRAQLVRVVKDIEAELGREMRYAVLSTSDFRYRLGVYDRLVRDVLDYPHRAVIDRIGITQITARVQQ
jgi:hypothetical protein